jgi:sulfur carrier protein
LNLIINGEVQQVPNTIENVQHLLEYLRLADRIVVVEVNRNILQKEQHSATPLAEGDVVELVHFVGGG